MAQIPRLHTTEYVSSHLTAFPLIRSHADSDAGKETDVAQQVAVATPNSVGDKGGGWRRLEEEILGGMW